MSSNKEGYAGRWFDQADFTSVHDQLFEQLLRCWKNLIPMLPRGATVHGDILGEPSLDGYPPIFPDAIARGLIELEGVKYDDGNFGKAFKIVYEIKPEIDSLGSVMRQLQLYRERADLKHYTLGDRGQVVLITPDDRFDESFRAQGFVVMHQRCLDNG